jgi:hypothetical protein
MNDPDNFLSRWSRRKREAGVDNPQPEKSGEQSNDRPTRPREQAGQAIPKDEAVRPPPTEFDVTSLPPIESIGAGTDISAFMRAGVPAALRHAALRRAWSADPAIRDFMGPTENYWDAAGPDGIPGFGELDPGTDVKRMVSELFGETAPESVQPESHVPPNTPERSVEISEWRDDRSSEGHDDRDKTVRSEAQQTAPHRTENAATQNKSPQLQPLQKISRRHGGAMPE